jgi:hypothetical protein
MFRVTTAEESLWCCRASTVPHVHRVGCYTGPRRCSIGKIAYRAQRCVCGSRPTSRLPPVPLCGAIGLLSCASFAFGAGEYETPEAAKGAGQMPVPTPMIGQKHRHHRCTSGRFRCRTLLATPIAETEPTAAALLISLFAEATGVALALLLQPLAVAVAGFAAGAMRVESLGVPHAGEGLLLILAGGLVGAVMMIIVFDAAVIVLSSVFRGATRGQGSAARARPARRRIRRSSPTSGYAVCTPTENDTTLAAEAAARRRDLNQQARRAPCGPAGPGRSPRRPRRCAASAILWCLQSIHRPVGRVDRVDAPGRPDRG